MNAQRYKLETEALAITEELTSGDPPMGVDTPLVDSEGFPLGTIDVHAALILRNRLAIIRTDHKVLMKQIEEGLLRLAMQSDPSIQAQVEEDMQLRSKPKPKPKYDNVTGKWVVCNSDGSVSGIEGGSSIRFEDIGNPEVDKVRGAALASAAAAAPTTSSSSSSSSSSQPSAPLPVFDADAQNAEPFAVVDSVAPHSPSADSGLKPGDLILKWGTVNASNHGNLKALGESTMAAFQRKSFLPAHIKRQNPHHGQPPLLLALQIRPREWAGKGVLGVNLLPYDDELHSF